ncbi:MAG: ABC transporter substrate-binding protein [Actinomycetota bacterium]|nr:ABC transporter substrate-binding protein [Actinomycetota bacterium]
MDHRVTRRDFLKKSAVAGVSLTTLPALLAACGGGGGTEGGGAKVPKSGKEMPMKELIAAAKEEGTLNTIALPPDWSNYGEVMETYQRKYGVRINNASPNAASAEEHEAAKALKGQERAPDVFDVGSSFAPQGKKDGLYAQYRNSYWDTIPDFMKDPEGYWVADYYGVIAFGINKDIVKNVPQDWQDLKRPEYEGQVALNGDPRTAGAAFAGVFAAALANGGSLDNIGPGIDFFAELKESGNLIPVSVSPANIANGQIPITIDWDYLDLGYGDALQGQVEWGVVVPPSGVFGNFYVQAINSDAPHPFAARLWQEFLYSDEGQLLWLEGYSHPARFDDMVERGVIPQKLLDKLPPPEPYENVEFPTQKQTDAATAQLQEEWGAKVGG